MPPERPKGLKKPHHTAQTKDTFLYALSLIRDLDLPVSQRALARHAGIPESTARRFISEAERETKVDRDGPPVENRGRKALLSTEDCERIERLMYEGGHDVRRLPYEDLPKLAGIDTFTGHKRTIARLVGQKEWRKCTICDRGWTQKDYAEARYVASKDALTARPTAESWRDVRFAEEAHFMFGGEGADKMLLREGLQECPDCLEANAATVDAEAMRGKKQGPRLHAWAAVGHDFKSELVWYKHVGALSQAVTQNAYIDDILTKNVKKWIRRGDKFVLEEDVARKHVLNQAVVKQWAEVYKLKVTASSTRNPDLSPIEEAWAEARSYLKEHIVWDEKALKEAVTESWEKVTQSRINEWVASMPQRHRETMEAGGYIKCHDPNRPVMQIPPPSLTTPKRPTQTAHGGSSGSNDNNTNTSTNNNMISHSMPAVSTVPAPQMHQHQQLPMPNVYPQLDHHHPLHQLYSSSGFLP